MTIFASSYPTLDAPVSYYNDLGLNSIAVTPYAFFSKGIAEFDSMCMPGGINCGMYDYPTLANMELIQMAHDQAMAVLLKPQIWSEHVWVGDLDYEDDAQWDTLEKSYSEYILKWAHIAENMEVEIFCVGTELRYFAEQRTQYWSDLIDSIRTIYNGKLTYASNWDDTHLFPLWDKMDYIGVDAYFPLIDEAEPSVSALRNAWTYKYFSAIKGYASSYQKPVLFTEFGYMSVDGASYNTWECEANKSSLPANEQAQANAVKALLQTFGQEEWWAGGFQWKCYANSTAATCETELHKEYTPKGKTCEEVFMEMY
jgi:hypothetical protein